jgi:hypothetical protein
MSADRPQIVEFSPGSRALREPDRAPAPSPERPAPAPQWGPGLNAYADGGGKLADLDPMRDIRSAFGDANVIRSSDLVAKLTADPERPLAEWKRGRP